jgi:hypothetical protein
MESAGLKLPCCEWLLAERRFLIARVHEGAGGALCAQIWIADGRASLLGVEAAGQQRVRLEARRAAAKLTDMRDDYTGAAVHGLYDAADLDLHVAIFCELADQVVVLPGADDSESAVVIGGLGRADVEEAGAVWKLHYIIDIRGNANVFVEHFGGLVGGDAGLGLGGGGRQGRECG